MQELHQVGRLTVDNFNFAIIRFIEGKIDMNHKTKNNDNNNSKQINK